MLVRPARDPAPNAKPAGFPVMREMLRPIPAACNAECDIPSATDFPLDFSLEYF